MDLGGNGFAFGSPAIGPSGSVYVVGKAINSGSTQLFAFVPPPEP